MNHHDQLREVYDAVARGSEEEVFRACLKVAVHHQRRPRGTRVQHPRDLAPALRSYANRQVECFGVVTLDGASQVIRVRVVTKGLVNRTLIHPREVLRPAIVDRAVAIIVFHNHPSGATSPSQDDREATRRLFRAAEIIGISLLDHLILAGADFYSFCEEGDLK